MERETIDFGKPVYTTTVDDRLGIIRTVVSGFFDRQTLEEHFAFKSLIVDRWRAQGRPVWVLVDATGLKPHSAENQVFVKDASARLYRTPDRVAMLVESNLVKMQMRRAMSLGDVANFFTSENAAITWLTAHCPGVPSSLS